MHFQRDLWDGILATDIYSTCKSEQPFWDTYRGCEEDCDKEYRMSQATFNIIAKDCFPFLYSRPTYSLHSARFRYLRSKVVMAFDRGSTVENRKTWFSLVRLSYAIEANVVHSLSRFVPLVIVWCVGCLVSTNGCNQCCSTVLLHCGDEVVETRFRLARKSRLFVAVLRMMHTSN